MTFVKMSGCWCDAGITELLSLRQMTSKQPLVLYIYCNLLHCLTLCQMPNDMEALSLSILCSLIFDYQSTWNFPIRQTCV